MVDKFTNPLERVRIAAPCQAEWKEMHGNERVRFCDKCSLNVYNLSAMTKREAERLVLTAEGRLCVRFYRRADGTIITRNCPVGVQALKRRLSRLANVAAATLLSFLTGLGLYAGLHESEPAEYLGGYTVTMDAGEEDLPPDFTVTEGAMEPLWKIPFVTSEAEIEEVEAADRIDKMSPPLEEKGEAYVEELVNPQP